MGVDKLESFMHVYNMKREVNLQELIQTFDQPNPIIVIEHMRLPNYFKDSYQETKDQISEFINEFKELGADIVIFVTIKSMSRGSAEIRRQKRRDEARRFYDRLYEHREAYIPEMPLHRQVILTAFAEAEVRFERGSRRDLIEFVKKENCVALLAQDSDFVIREEPKYFSIMALRNMKTFKFNRGDLMSKLNLSSDKLPLFAALVGCTYVDRKMLEPLHKFLLANVRGRGQFALVWAVADFVRKIPTADFKMALEKHLSSEVISLLLLVVEWYSGKDEPAKLEELTFPLPYSVRTLEARSKLFKIGYETYTLPMYHDDERDPKFVHTCERLLSLRRKVYGVLFREREFIVENSIVGMREVRFDRPKVPLPDLDLLWSDTATEEIRRVRRHLFCDGVHSQLVYEELERLPKRFVLPICALIYLQNDGSLPGKDLSETEVRCLLATILSVDQWRNIVPRSVRMTPRCFQVSTIFMGTCSLLWMFNIFCGQVIPVEETCPSNYFNMKLLSTFLERPQEVCKILEESRHYVQISDCLNKFMRD